MQATDDVLSEKRRMHCPQDEGDKAIQGQVIAMNSSQIDGQFSEGGGSDLRNRLGKEKPTQTMEGRTGHKLQSEMRQGHRIRSTQKVHLQSKGEPLVHQW